MKILLFIFVLLAIFGPKVGFFDFSISSILVVIVSYLYSERKICKDKSLSYIVLVTTVYLIYILIVSVLTGVQSVDMIFRTGRAMLIMICIILFSKTLVRFNLLLIPIIFYLSLAHSLMVALIATIFPEWQLILDSAFGVYRPEFVDGKYRSGGLLAGFEIAGVFCLLGIYLIVCNVYKFKNWFFEFLLLLIFVICTLFTSRTIILLAILTLFFYTLKILFFKKNVTLFQKFIIGLPLVLSLTLLSFYFTILLDVALNLNFFDISGSMSADILKRFSSVTLGDGGLTSMYFFPEKLSAQVFGLGIDMPESDVGYVKLVYWHGLLGLGLLILTHFILIASTMRFAKRYARIGDRLFIALIYTTIFVLTFKNNYLFTRAVWPLLILIYYYYYGLSMNMKIQGHAYSKSNYRG